MKGHHREYHERDSDVPVQKQESNAKQKIDINELTRQFDVQSRYRHLKGNIGVIVAWIAVSMSVFHTDGLNETKSTSSRFCTCSYLFALSCTKNIAR